MAFHVRAVDDEYSFLALTTGGEPQLRDLRNDPQERTNIAGDNPKIVKRMYEYVMADAQHQPILPDWEKQVGEAARRFSFPDAAKIPNGPPISKQRLPW